MRLMLTKIIEHFERVGRARAASQFARMGRYDLAKQILIKED